MGGGWMVLWRSRGNPMIAPSSAERGFFRRPPQPQWLRTPGDAYGHAAGIGPLASAGVNHRKYESVVCPGGRARCVQHRARWPIAVLQPPPGREWLLSTMDSGLSGDTR